MLAVVHRDGPRRPGHVGPQGEFPDRRLHDRPARAVPAAHRRGPSSATRHARRVEDVAWDLSWEPGPPATSTSTRCCAARRSPRRSSSCRTATSSSPARSASAGAAEIARRRPRRPGAPVGLQARAGAGRGRTAATSSTRTASRARRPSSTGSRSSCPASGARSGRARRSSGASAARTSPRPAAARAAHAEPFGLTGWRFEARDGDRRIVARSTRRASSWPASPTTTPTASWPTATTARWRRCASRDRPRGPPVAAADTLVATAARTSSTPSASRCRTWRLV